MKLIDLSHRIEPGMPVYPGTEPPMFTTECELHKDGFIEHRISFFSHTGTHVDAPAHILADGMTLDRMPVTQFFGNALRIDVDPEVPEIAVDTVKKFERLIGAVDFLFFHTGWSKWWGSSRYFENYPVLHSETARWLDRFVLKGIGLDTISADVADTRDFPVHKTILAQNRIIIENLTHLNQIPSEVFQVACFPLHFVDGDGSPVRAVAFADEA